MAKASKMYIYFNSVIALPRIYPNKIVIDLGTGVHHSIVYTCDNVNNLNVHQQKIY